MKTLIYAIRFLLRSKSYTIINLLGLAFSLACCIILMRYIHRELTVDTHCVDREQVYATVVTMEGNRGLSGISDIQYDKVQIDPRQIDKSTSFHPLEKDFAIKEGQRFFTRTIVTDSVFFQLFQYPLVQGSIALDKPESVLLKESFAQKMFGTENPIGKTIRHSNGKDLVVEGIIGEPTCKTSFQFDIVISLALSNQRERNCVEIYRFMPGTDMEKLNQYGSIPRYFNDPQWDSRQTTFSFVPMKDIYWDASTSDGEDTMFFYGSKRKDANAPMVPIVAVVKDYYNGHLSAGAAPILYNGSGSGGPRHQIAFPEGKKQYLLNYLKKTMKEVYGAEEFTYSFLEDDVKALYKEDQKIASIYNIFAFIAITVSCLGLFGISLFDIRQRYREIAIRKAHGAGMKDLYQLLFKKYFLVLGASFVVATPLAYYLIHQYTADFVVKAPIGIGIFVIALLLVALISMGTLWWQIRKAANIDPATVMKTE